MIHKLKAGMLSCETGVNGQNSTVSSQVTVYHLFEYCVNIRQLKLGLAYRTRPSVPTTWKQDVSCSLQCETLQSRSEKGLLETSSPVDELKELYNYIPKLV